MHYRINPWTYHRYAFWITPAITGQYKPTRHAQDYSLDKFQDNANKIGEPLLLVEVHVPVCKRTYQQGRSQLQNKPMAGTIIGLRVATYSGPAQRSVACNTEMQKRLEGSGDGRPENF